MAEKPVEVSATPAENKDQVNKVEMKPIIGDSDKTGTAVESIDAPAEEIDEELDDLLDSALNDFEAAKPASLADRKDSTKQADSVSVGGDVGSAAAGSANLPELTGDIDEQIKQLLGSDPQLLQGFEQLNNAAQQSGANSNPEQAFADAMAQTLNSLSANAEKLNDTGFDEESFVKILEESLNLGAGGSSGAGGETAGSQSAESEPDILPMMQHMMENLLSREVLYPSLKDLAGKYPAWLAANKTSVTVEQFDKYCTQFDIVSKLIDEYDSEQQSDSSSVKSQRFEKILDLMAKMQECGPPPKDIVSSLAPGLNFDTEGNPMMPGLDQQCSIM